MSEKEVVLRSPLVVKIKADRCFLAERAEGAEKVGQNNPLAFALCRQPQLSK